METSFPEAPPGDAGRRRWLLATTACGGLFAALAALPFGASLAPGERARAQRVAVEVDFADLPPGGTRKVEWGGRPVWIVRRTPGMIAALRGHDAALADPASLRARQPAEARNATRSIRPDIFVAVGICTHLGCPVIAVPPGGARPGFRPDGSGGFLCPCHGATFDGAGRVFRNQSAPTHLEVPPHRYLGATRLLIGEDMPA